MKEYEIGVKKFRFGIQDTRQRLIGDNSDFQKILELKLVLTREMDELKIHIEDSWIIMLSFATLLTSQVNENLPKCLHS